MDTTLLKIYDKTHKLIKTMLHLMLCFEEGFMYASKPNAYLWPCPRCKAPLQPGTAICYSCGYQFVPIRPNSTIQPARSALSYRNGKGPSGTEKNRAAFYYFISVIFAIVLITLVAIHASGISPSTIFSKGAAPTAIIKYPTPPGTPLFFDNFLSDTYGWNLQSSPGNYAVTTGNGTLTMQVNKNNLLWELLPGERSYSNFTLTVNAVLSKGDQNNGYGVYIRATSNSQTDLATYYRFALYGDGSYAIFKGIIDPTGKSVDTKIVDYTLSSAIQKQGKFNQIMITARGADLSFIVNGQLLKTITDASYTSGSVALFVANLPQAKPGATAQFSRLAIYAAH